MKMSLGVSPYTDELVCYFLLMAPCVFFFWHLRPSIWLGYRRIRWAVGVVKSVNISCHEMVTLVMAEPHYPQLHPSSESSHTPHTPHRAIVDLLVGWPLCSLLRMAAGSADTPLCPPDTPALRSLHQDCQHPVQWASKCHQAHGAASVPTEMTHADTAVTAAYLRNREPWWWKASPQLVLGAEPLGSWKSCLWCATSMGFPWGCPPWAPAAGDATLGAVWSLLGWEAATGTSSGWGREPCRPSQSHFFPSHSCLEGEQPLMSWRTEAWGLAPSLSPDTPTGSGSAGPRTLLHFSSLKQPEDHGTFTSPPPGPFTCLAIKRKQHF